MSPPRTHTITQAEELLRSADPCFATVIDSHGPCTIALARTDDSTPFSALATSVVSQQLSTPIARTLASRLKDLVGAELTAEAVAGTTVDDLRALGLSAAKARTILGLANAVTTGSLDLDALSRHGDDATIYDSLTSLWGIGPWTVHMFLIFHLGRLDVWPVGDLGVRKGWQVIHGGDGDPGPSIVQAAADHLMPYRSVAAWYCWRAWDSASRKAT